MTEPRAQHVHQFLYDQPNRAPFPFSDACECGVMRDYAANHHPYQIIRVDGRPTKIDEGMVDVLETLWTFGVRTAHCCQGGCPVDDFSGRQSRGYVSFATAHQGTALRILRDQFEITDTHDGVTLLSTGDKLASAVYFTSQIPCELCALAAESWS